MMNLAEDLVDVSHADLQKLSTEIRQTGRPKLITRDGVGDLVLLPVADYEELKDALEVASGLLRGEQDLAAGQVSGNSEVQERLRARLAAAAGSVTQPRLGGQQWRQSPASSSDARLDRDTEAG